MNNMIDKKFKYIIFISFILIINNLVFISKGFAKENDINRNIDAYGDIKYPPFEYEENGIMVGFNIDILNAVAKETGINININGGRWTDIRTGLESGNIEMLSGMFYSEERDKLVDFSVPFLRVDYVAFVNENSDIEKLEDLKDKIIIVEKGDIMEDYIIENNISQNYQTVGTPIEAMILLERNTCDAVFIGNFQGKYIEISEDLEGLRALDEVLVQREYCFGIKEGNEGLKNTLDQGLNIIKVNGKYDEIYEKWFDEPFKSEELENLLDELLMISIVIILIFFGYSGWVFLLRKKVNSKTAELEELNSDLELLVWERTKELEETINQLRETKHQLIQSEKMAVLGDLVGGITHEINTPIGICLTSITYYNERVEYLKKKYKQGELTKSDLEQHIIKSEEIGSMMLYNLEKSGELIRNFKQISEDHGGENPEEFDIVKKIKDVYLSIRPKYRDYNHSFEILGYQKLIIKGHPSYISQILENLLLNSFKHGYCENRKLNIKLELSEINNFLQIKYSDDGNGVSTENMKSIFNPFFTTDRTNGGTGLGLNIVDTIVRYRMKGSLYCTSELDKGIEFTIKIPKVHNQ